MLGPSPVNLGISPGRPDGHPRQPRLNTGAPLTISGWLWTMQKSRPTLLPYPEARIAVIGLHPQGRLVCLTVCRRGAVEVVRRLAA